MKLLVLGLGVPELLIILAVVLLLFGGSRLAGLGKSTGRALKEFKEETKGLKGDEKEGQASVEGAETPVPPQQTYGQPPTQQSSGYQQPQSHQQPVYEQPPAQNPDGSEIRKDV